MGTERVAGREQPDLDYCVEWRPYLWRRPVQQALAFLGDVSGKHILEIGGRSGKMSCLFAMQGARVTMLERGSVDAAQAEAKRWGVGDRVRAVATDGTMAAIAGQRFDIVFTKSVLWSIERLEPVLTAFDDHLAPGGRIAFVENNRGGKLLQWLRWHVAHRKTRYQHVYHGIRPDQLDLFRRHFDTVKVRSYLGLVYVITGRKAAQADLAQTGASQAAHSSH